jgi:hypothetical protein
VSQDGQLPDDYCAADDTDPAASGVLTVRTEASAWVLPPTRALWIPAGLPHETLSAGAATMRSAYLRPHLCPVSWPDPTPVAASPLLCDLIGYLENRDLTPGQRARGEGVLADQLSPARGRLPTAWPRRRPTGGPWPNGGTRSAPASARWPALS